MSSAQNQSAGRLIVTNKIVSTDRCIPRQANYEDVFDFNRSNRTMVEQTNSIKSTLSTDLARKLTAVYAATDSGIYDSFMGIAERLQRAAYWKICDMSDRSYLKSRFDFFNNKQELTYI